MSKKRYANYFDGIAVLGDNIVPGALGFSVNEEPKMITHKGSDGEGDTSWPIGRAVSGTITYNEVTAAFFAAMTGGALTTGTIKRVRQGEESQTISENAITLAEGADVIGASVQLWGKNGTYFQKVAGTPEVGEFSLSASGVCTFNASETETTIYPAYLYADAANGKTLTIDKHDVPSEMELYGVLRTKEIASGGLGDMVIHLAKVNRSGAINWGAEGADNTQERSVDFTARIVDPGDFKVYFPDA